MSLRASVLGALLGAVIAFGTACPDGPTDPTDTDPDSGTDTASDPDGQDLYESHCQGCHGAGGGGTGSGPALAGHLAGKTEQPPRRECQHIEDHPGARIATQREREPSLEDECGGTLMGGSCACTLHGCRCMRDLHWCE